MRFLRILVCLTILLAGAKSVAAAQKEDRSRRQCVATLVDTAPVVDGKLLDTAWQSTQPTEPFVAHGGDGEARLRTQAWLVYTEDALHLALRCEEPKPGQLVRGYTPGDPGSWGDDDTIEVFLDPGDSRAQFYQLICNPDGPTASGYDCDFQNPLRYTAAGFVGPDFWSLEVRIPFDSLGGRPAPGDVWGLNLCRTRPPKGEDETRELSTWNPTPGGFQRPDRFGQLLLGGPPGCPPPQEPPDLSVYARIRKRVDQERGKGLRWGFADVPSTARLARWDALAGLARYLSRFPNDVLWSSRPPIANERILPWSVPPPFELYRPLRLRACRGEYEPATFALFPLRDLARVELAVSDLAGDQGAALPAKTVDLREVKCWYQSGSATMRPILPVLIPELLLHDPALVTVDPKKRENLFKFSGYPRDAETLQPTDLPAFESRQFWLTLRVPDDAPPGTYRGAVVARQKGQELARIPLEVEVLDFDLEPSPLLHSLYYTRRLQGGSDEFVRAQLDMMAGEIANQIEHGVNLPTTYVHPGKLPGNDDPFATYHWLCDVYERNGLATNPLICVTLAVGTQETAEQLARIRKMVRGVVEFSSTRGRGTAYFQGQDEAAPEVLRRERQAFQAVHDAGGKVFVACGSDYFDAAGDLLDLPVVAGILRPDLARKVQAEGHRILVYANPWGGYEKPAVYRRNYGLQLWLAGYDGVMNWQYADTGMDGWDDWRENSRRYNMAYPALERPIDTVQWEGWREGVDDLRYLATLLARLDAAERAGTRAPVVKRIRRWLSSLEGDEDLDAVRERMVRAIQALGGR